MLKKIKDLFSKKPIIDIKAFEAKWPVGSWYKSGDGIIRLSNIYIKNNQLLITVEKPVAKSFPLTANPSGFYISKEDDLSPSYLNGWIRVEEKEVKKLERSYWKTIEKDLANKTDSMTKFYDSFVKAGEK